MTRGVRWLRLALLLGSLLVAVQGTAQLPPCDTCTCSSGCYVNNCQVNGYPLSCGDWGICEFSCACGGQC